MKTARELAYSGSWPRVRRAVLLRDKGICHICGRPGATAVDHLVPVSIAGPRIPPLNQLAAVHIGCNSRRARELERKRGARGPWQRPVPTQPRQVWNGAVSLD